MPRPLPPAYQAIVDLESRQDEVLALLDQLEQRVGEALRQFGAVVTPGDDGRTTISLPISEPALRAAG
jgi:hypothetical protein